MRERGARRARSLVIAATLAVLAMPLLASDPRGPDVQVWAEGALVKVRPFHRQDPDRPATVRLQAARNEFESFQIVVRPRDQALAAVDVEMSALRGPAGSVIDARHAAVYLEVFLDVRQPSSVEGGTGLWPDALVPRVDRYAGERRRAFPFRVDAARSQPIWVELYVPRETRPGIYHGEATIRAAEHAPYVVPVELGVWGFTLPSTSSLPTIFGVDGPGALHQHYRGRGGEEALLDITNVYTRGALLHRLTTYGGTMAGPRFSGNVDTLTVDWEFYDRELAPFLDGRVFGAQDPLPGARATRAEMRLPRGLDQETRIALTREYIRHFENRGWKGRLYHYLWDEPRPEDYPELRSHARATRAADKMLPMLVTNPYDESLADILTIVTPVVNCLDDKPVRHPFCPGKPGREEYRRLQSGGRRLFWYQSCGSHGCDVVGDDYFTGWPSYAVDVDTPVAHRIMEWLTWKYGIEGELYFNTMEAYGRDADPWTDIHMHGGNGDGTLFYPGRPERIGGSTHIPVESVRLKLIRDGLEDFEYFVLLAESGRRALVDEQVGRVVRLTYDWDSRPETMEAARRRLGDELHALKL